MAGRVYLKKRQRKQVNWPFIRNEDVSGGFTVITFAI